MTAKAVQAFLADVGGEGLGREFTDERVKVRASSDGREVEAQANAQAKGSGNKGHSQSRALLDRE